MTKTISILGCGWLGKPLAEQLIKSGYRVKGSTRSVSKLNLLTAIGIEPFIVNIEVPDRAMIDFLQSRFLIIDITSKDLAGFAALLKMVEKSPVENVIFISSTSVYPALNDIVTEETETDEHSGPLVSIENLFMDSQKIKTTVIRFAGLFGYDRRPGNFFCGDKTISDPEGRVNMIHRDDCIRLIEEVLKQEVWGEIFNGCADSHPTKKEFYTKAARDIQTPEPVFEKNSTPSFKIVSNNKIKNELGFICNFNDLMVIDFATC